MTDTEKGIKELAVQNREILHELSLIEDVLKTLLVNNLLDDTEKLVSTSENPNKNVQSKTADNTATEELADLQAQIDYFENKLRNMIGKKCHICKECKEFYDADKNQTTLGGNPLQLYYEIKDYDFGMFLLYCKTKKCEYKYWVSFDMIIIM